MSKWDELKGAIGPGDIMTKRRNSQAVAAWSRHQGSHSPGTKKPIVDDTDEQLEEVDCLVYKCPICTEKSSCTHEEETDDKEG
jgi:hypothetical protein